MTHCFHSFHVHWIGWMTLASFRAEPSNMTKPNTMPATIFFLKKKKASNMLRFLNGIHFMNFVLLFEMLLLKSISSTASCTGRGIDGDWFCLTLGRLLFVHWMLGLVQFCRQWIGLRFDDSPYGHKLPFTEGCRTDSKLEVKRYPSLCLVTSYIKLDFGCSTYRLMKLLYESLTFLLFCDCAWLRIQLLLEPWCIRNFREPRVMCPSHPPSHHLHPNGHIFLAHSAKSTW